MPDSPASDDEGAIRAQAIKLLARREHAWAEMARKLGQRGYERAAVARVLEALTADDLLSETRYAASVVRSRVGRGQGPARIAAELARAGIGQDAADDAIADAEVDWRESALAARTKRFGSTPPVDRHQRLKQMRFLRQRGFYHQDIAAAVELEGNASHRGNPFFEGQ